MIRLCGCFFYMCPCCTGLRIWMGDGSDFDAKECPCWRFGGSRSLAIGSFNSRVASEAELPYSSSYLCQFPGTQESTAVSCIVCGSASVFAKARMILPDAQNRKMRRVNFCRKHCPPEHMLNTITGFDEVDAVLKHVASRKARR